jgi:hypothetical protein
MTWVPFESNDPRTWGKVQSLVSQFLNDLFKEGMFAGGNPEQAFYVKCDAETNTPVEVDQGLLTCQIGVAPVCPAEFMMISITQNTSDG